MYCVQNEKKIKKYPWLDEWMTCLDSKLYFLEF